MARWFKEHLGFKTTKAPPPAPPKPDYRHFHTAVSSPPAFHLQQQPGTGLMSAQPDILTAYKLQKELDFEDPYTPGGNVPFSTGLSSAGSPDIKYVSPKHRLIKVETVERSSSSSGSSSGVTAVKTPSSPPAEPENSNGKQEKLIILEDYADPFDAADQAGGTQTVTEKPAENDGYMEPYEAQKMMAVQFDGVEKSRMSPTKDLKSRPLQRHSSGCLVNTKMSSLDPSGPSVGERIDPSMPLESQFWYHGAISRTDAESLLRLCKEASYLVRNSETSKNDFSLSLKSSQGFMHMKLSRTKDNKYILGQNSCLFDSVPEIIHFYSSRKLPIKGAEHMSLLYPVAIRTL
ncbi:SH2 domain-containing adapter protein F isoform X3 [Chanodichthys erythropterus]|uniref:SH2 domain-containing adapter protein F isoform X3 n=1 Tax=Chanodichthys erythropterus TaxID=933992 RepID=UPI00351EF34A